MKRLFTTIMVVLSLTVLFSCRKCVECTTEHTYKPRTYTSCFDSRKEAKEYKNYKESMYPTNVAVPTNCKYTNN
jgi:hypothetical protein